MVPHFCILASRRRLNFLSNCGILRADPSGFHMNILQRCTTIIDSSLTNKDKLECVFDCIKTYGASTHDEWMDVFDMGVSLINESDSNARNNLHYYFMGAQATYIAGTGLNTSDSQRLLKEFYTDLIYEDPEYMWFEHIKHCSLLKPIESKDWCHVFDNCHNSEKLARVLSEGLFNVDEELFGVQSWLTTSLAQSANVFALRGFGQSLKHLLSHLSDEDFFVTSQTLIEEMTQYGLYTHYLDTSKNDFFIELLDHTSVFNQGLPHQARINHKSMLQRLDLLLHDTNALDGQLLQYVSGALDEEWPSEIIVTHMGAHLSDLWANCGKDQLPNLAAMGSTQWPAPVFDHFLSRLSIDQRIQVLYMGLGRLRSKNTIMPPSQPIPMLAHLSWMEDSWKMRPLSFSEAKWEEYEADNLSHYLIPVRAANRMEEWIFMLIERLDLSAVSLVEAIEQPVFTTEHEGLKCTPWPQQLLRKHPFVQQAIIAFNLADNSVSTVKKM